MQEPVLELIPILCPYLNYIELLVLRRTSKSIYRKIPKIYLIFEEIIKERLVIQGYSPDLFDILKKKKICLGGNFLLGCLYNKNLLYRSATRLVLVIEDYECSSYYERNDTLEDKLNNMILISHSNNVCSHVDIFDVITYIRSSNKIDYYCVKISISSGKYITSHNKMHHTFMLESKVMQPTIFEIISQIDNERHILYDWNKLYIKDFDSCYQWSLRLSI